MSNCRMFWDKSILSFRLHINYKIRALPLLDLHTACIYQGGEVLTKPLQLIKNVTDVHQVFNQFMCCHITPLLHFLLWLPVYAHTPTKPTTEQCQGT